MLSLNSLSKRKPLYPLCALWDSSCLRYYASSASSINKKYRLKVPVQDTVSLPKTTFPMKSNAITREPELQEEIGENLYRLQEKVRQDCPEWVLHDGPPYANGSLHVGHALNKILKDIITRYKLLKGYRVSFIPGWDCHGLPIELKALESLKKEQSKSKGNDSKTEMSGIEIRKIAKEWARNHVEIQMADFKRWGIMADWSNHYSTYSKEYEVAQLRLFREMYEKGMIFRALKPVYWSPASRTALAESELEYVDNHKSRAAYVKYRLSKDSLIKLEKAVNVGENESFREVSAVIWTTTPWTLPGSMAIAYGNDLMYALLRNEADESLYLISENLISNVMESFKILHRLSGDDMEKLGLEAHHPFFNRIVPFVSSEFVSDNSGTGLVHTAPAHGQEDFIVSQRNGISTLNCVNLDGKFNDQAGESLSGKSIHGEGQVEILSMLSNSDSLIRVHNHTHRYPFDWRTKKPVIQIATEQWFISLESVKSAALRELDKIDIFPPSGRPRLISTIQSRNDWCISRQRHWGVPIPAFRNPVTKEVIMSSETIRHFESLVEKYGTDCWWTLSTEELLPSSLRSMNLQKTYDTLDVWFDSGSSWKAVFSKHPNRLPVDLVIEGSDQHRGWFQSLLLTSLAGTGKSPYKAILSHGFVVDNKNQKMSKSLGNVIEPNEIVLGLKGKFPALGADVLRYWVACSVFWHDIAVSPETINLHNSAVRKIRNTLRYFIGVLHDFEEKAIPSNPHILLNPLEKWIFALAVDLLDTAEKCYESNEIAKLMKLTETFASQSLSQVYFGSIKIDLYAESSSMESQILRKWTLNRLFLVLMKVISPVLPNTVQDVMSHIANEDLRKSVLEGSPSFFLTAWPSRDFCEQFRDPNLLEVWKDLLELRSLVHAVMDDARKNKMFQGDFSEIGLSMIFPTDFHNTRLFKLIDELSAANQLHSLFFVSTLEFLKTDPETSILKSVDIPLQTFEGGVSEPLRVFLRPLINHSKCQRCRKNVEKESILNVELDETNVPLCTFCVDLLLSKDLLQPMSNDV